MNLRYYLLDLAKNYDGGWADIKPRLDGVRMAVFNELSTMYKDRGFWTNRNDWHGAKPQVPWVSFGTNSRRFSSFAESNRGNEKEIIHLYKLDKPIPSPNDVDVENVRLFLNYQWTARRRDVYLTLLPFAEGWLARFGPNWSSIFKPIKKEIRSKIAWLASDGFRLDDYADLEASSRTGNNMQLGYIAYVRYDRKSMPDDVKLRSDLKKLTDTYISLVSPNHK